MSLRFKASAKSTCAARACPAARRGRMANTSCSERGPQPQPEVGQTDSKTHQVGTRSVWDGAGCEETDAIVVKRTSRVGWDEADSEQKLGRSMRGINHKSTSLPSKVRAEKTVEPGCQTFSNSVSSSGREVIGSIRKTIRPRGPNATKWCVK